MAPFGTPSPFRPPSARLSTRHRNNAGSQFASTPRFLLSQSSSEKAEGRDKHDIVDTDEHLPSSPVPVHGVSAGRGAVKQRGSASRQKELIEDSDEEVLPTNDGCDDSPIDGSKYDAFCVDPPHGLDPELEILFGSSTDRRKRRLQTPQAQRKRAYPDTFDKAISEEIGLPGLPSSLDQSPQKGEGASAIETPRPSVSGNFKTPFRPPPRFILSSSQTPSGTPQSSNTRKPAFVLPRSPSPPGAGEEGPDSIPTPFSPSSRTLNRRGRPWKGGPTYIPGGMASEVRGWILDMGAKRDQRLGSDTATQSASPRSPDQYVVILRVDSVRQSALASSGPLAFVRGEPIRLKGGLQQVQRRNFLLLGPSRPRPVPDLQRGNIIGIYRGLAWEIDLGGIHEDGGVGNPAPGMILGDIPSDLTETEKWFVGVEWDLLPE
ncbi:hypothetical protein ASPZODRAFT_140975 [Penicilliopsis zonata CBS 506.65]|uniref:Uncharacterized protein n=1 Tax=Penicilliopsis zonata CBS 506.65 TaxID=1073090 RepID=A0A1L9SNT7_9EURO|nr:hypothetical protein ASPZODRAFT_140975 [Penicilliopsis zonata CBS 506.65]OJJ48707.1 hypothetical protein ASPZODRAFT_140975 [Penicilliopsis zonata CBS 506.65]